MPQIPPIVKSLCAPWTTAHAASEAARGISSGEGALRRLNVARLALDGTVTDQMAYLEIESSLERIWREGHSLLTPNDAQSIIASVPMRPATLEVFKAQAGNAFAKVKQALGLRYESANQGSVLNARLRSLKVNGTLLHQFSNHVPAEEMLRATSIKDPRARAAAIRNLADPSTLSRGLGDWNRADITTYGFSSHEDLFSTVQKGISKLTNAQANAFGDAYAYSAKLFAPAKAARIARWRAENPSEILSDLQVMKKVGMGDTLGAYAAHVFDKESRTGYINYLAEASRASGESPLSHIGLPYADGTNLFMDRLRSVVSASESKPFKSASGKLFTSPESAMKAMFPNMQGDPEIRRHLALIQSASRSKSDAGMWVALNPAFTDRFLIERSGQQGFITNFMDANDAYVLAASRQIHLDPLTAPGGAWSSFINELARVDHSMATSMAGRFRSLTGRTLIDDPAVQEFYGVASKFARRIYKATSLAYPGFAIPNSLSLPMLLIPEAVRSKGGWRDLFSALPLAASPEFKRLMEFSGLRATVDQTEVKAVDMMNRLRQASSDGDARAGWVAVKEWGGDLLSYVNWIEAHAVRPYSAAVGVARWARESGFNLSALENLSPEQKRDVIRSMIEVTEKVTILPGSSNTLPVLNGVRRIPFIGPLSVMFTSSPSTIAGSMLANFRQMVRGPDKASAARVFGTQLFFGTLVAGPFWFFPFMREMQKLPGVSQEDTEAYIGALNSWERRFSLAGWMHSDLAGRMNPITGIAERFTGDKGLAQIALGPLGRPVQDAWDGLVGGDEPAKRRMAGALAPMLFDLPPSGILPSSLQIALPAAVGFEKFGRVALATMSDPRGYVSLGPLGLPVKNPEGWKIDALGRPSSPVTSSGELRSFILGGRSLLDSQSAAEGLRAKSRSELKASVESTLRRQLLSGDTQGALATFNENRSSRPVITISELEREAFMRKLPPQARAIYAGDILDNLPRIREAAARLQSGGLDEMTEKNERAILLVGLMRLRTARRPKGVILGG